MNRYAKPVSFTEIIALDEDDVVAIACRDLLENHPLFKQGRVSLEKRKSLAPKDRKSFTSITAVYQAADIYLMEDDKSQWAALKTVRPANEEAIQKFLQKANGFWNFLVKAIPQLRKVQDLKPDQPLLKSLP